MYPKWTNPKLKVSPLKRVGREKGRREREGEREGGGGGERERETERERQRERERKRPKPGKVSQLEAKALLGLP